MDSDEYEVDEGEGPSYWQGVLQLERKAFSQPFLSFIWMDSVHQPIILHDLLVEIKGSVSWISNIKFYLSRQVFFKTVSECQNGSYYLFIQTPSFHVHFIHQCVIYKCHFFLQIDMSRSYFTVYTITPIATIGLTLWHQHYLVRSMFRVTVEAAESR